MAILVLLVLGAGTAGAWGHSTPPTPTVLATVPLVATVVANSTTVFAQGVTNCSDIWAISTSGNVSLYATVPQAMSICEEGALALAPYSISVPYNPGNVSNLPRDAEWGHGGGGHGGHGGRGGCGCRSNETLYDALDGVLYEITDGGTNVSTVATFPGVPDLTSENMGLTYDQVGWFNNDLIVTSSAGGMIWLVNSSGNVTLFAQLHTYIGGPAVAPGWFGSYGGDLLVAAKHLNAIVALNSSGNASVVANWTTPNAVGFQSGGGHGWGGWDQDGCGSGSCSFGPNHDVLFVANYSSGAVEGFPESDVQSYAGQGFIAGGLNAGIGTFTSGGTTSMFASQTQRLSDLAFIDCFQCYAHCGGGHHHIGHCHDGWGGDR
ncbi:MAG: hypothetical protein WB809_07935 [Thermoplasmata archaeon]